MKTPKTLILFSIHLVILAFLVGFVRESREQEVKEDARTEEEINEEVFLFLNTNPGKGVSVSDPEEDGVLGVGYNRLPSPSTNCTARDLYLLFSEWILYES